MTKLICPTLFIAILGCAGPETTEAQPSSEVIVQVEQRPRKGKRLNVVADFSEATALRKGFQPEFFRQVFPSMDANGEQRCGPGVQFQLMYHGGINGHFSSQNQQELYAWIAVPCNDSGSDPQLLGAVVEDDQFVKIFSVEGAFIQSIADLNGDGLDELIVGDIDLQRRYIVARAFAIDQSRVVKEFGFAQTLPKRGAVESIVIFQDAEGMFSRRYACTHNKSSNRYSNCHQIKGGRRF